MSDLKTRVKGKVDKSAGVGKQAAGQAIDKTKEVANKVGEKLEKGAQRLKKA